MDEIEVVEVGEYIRTDDGIIAKVNNIDELRIDIPTDRAVYRIWVDDYYGNHKEDRFIKLHSKNIIDLIEVGDYVNGFKIYNMEYITYNNHIDLVFTIFKTPIDFTSPYKVIVTWQEKDIKSILTHEMYEQNCYKIGE